jgi:hypothetical protein
MSMGKARKGIIKNGILVSVMAFYFSCGKDVFPPDSPDEISSERGVATASLIPKLLITVNIATAEVSMQEIEVTMQRNC